MGATESDHRPLAKLIVDQCEFANIIIINKCDLIDDDKKQKIRKLLALMNPTAKIIESNYSSIPLEDIFNTGLYERDLTEFMAKPSWEEELAIGADHESELEKYGIISTSFVNNERPFHPERLFKLISGEGSLIFDGVLRGKGYFWVANDFDSRFDFNIAGPMFTIIVNTVWLEPAMRNLMSPDYVKQYLEQNEGGDIEAIKMQRRQILQDMRRRFEILMSDGVERKFGDRRIEMVFIGEDDKMNVDGINAKLNECLLVDGEMDKGPKYWNEMYQDVFKNVPRCIVI